MRSRIAERIRELTHTRCFGHVRGGSLLVSSTREDGLHFVIPCATVGQSIFFVVVIVRGDFNNKFVDLIFADSD